MRVQDGLPLTGGVAGPKRRAGLSPGPDLACLRTEAPAHPAVDHPAALAYMSRMHLGTWLLTLFKGHLVGTDAAGNNYYQERAIRPNGRARRWIMYRGAVEASAVPPEWHSWLHYTTDKPIQESARRPWSKPHIANQTGTPAGYRPPGHDYEGGRRDHATGDYEAWTPGSE